MSVESPPAISILLCTRNRPDHIRRGVPTIIENHFRDFELLVVDQSDDRATIDFLESLGDPRIRVIATASHGLARARNIAILEARSPIVAFTDDDCLCDSGWIEAILAAFRDDPGLDGVYGKVLPWGDHFAEGLFCHCLISSEEAQTVQEAVPPHQYLGHGNNMAFRRGLFRAIGLYNPAMGAGTRLKSGEDTDLTYRALRARRRLKYSPRPLVYHNNWNTLAQADRLDLGYVKGFVAIFGKFALRGDRVALKCLRERLGELIRDLRQSLRDRDKRRFIAILKKLLYYALGIFQAVRFRLAGDLPWPADRA